MTPYDPALFVGTAWYYARSLEGRGWLLDLGAGTGEVAVPQASQFEQVVAVEPDAGMIAGGEARPDLRGRATSAGNTPRLRRSAAARRRSASPLSGLRGTGWTSPES